jgi:hypothetical protein
VGSHEVEIVCGGSRGGKDIPSSSTGPPCCCDGGSEKNKVAQILADVAGVVSPWMRHSFVERQYSPSSGIHHSEWEIILEEHIRMRFLVKHEPVSEGKK